MGSERPLEPHPDALHVCTPATGGGAFMLRQNDGRFSKRTPTLYWPLWTVLYSPAAAAASVAALCSRLPIPKVWALLGLFLALISAAMGVAFAYDAHLSVLVGGHVLLTAIFFLGRSDIPESE
jgi:hypothetical protein